MAQFDVYRSPGRRRREVPFVVVIQSAWFDNLPTRMVVPLLSVTALTGNRRHLFPEFTINGQRVLLAAWQVQTVPLSALGPVVASLAGDPEGDQIINALDLVISRAHG
jgi:toxin CcdB